MKKLVSIIVPVFNVEKYLRQCLDSILGQTFNQFEVIIVNDGSTDNSGAICQEYEARDNRIVYLEKENGGVSEARNLGLDFATSEYIIFIDSDDWIEPTYVEVYMKKLKNIKQILFLKIIPASMMKILTFTSICQMTIMKKFMTIIQ